MSTSYITNTEGGAGIRIVVCIYTYLHRGRGRMIQDIAIQYECSADKQAMFDNVEQYLEKTQLLASSNSTIY